MSPASAIKISPFFKSDELIFLIEPSFNKSFAGVSCRVFLNESACALPLASAIASAKFANRTVSKRRVVINQIINEMNPGRCLVIGKQKLYKALSQHQFQR